MPKNTLLHQLGSHQSLDYAQLEFVFSQTAYILNSRPLGIRNFSHEEFHAVMPNDLLLGRTAGDAHEGDPEQEGVQLAKNEVIGLKQVSAVEEVVEK